MTKKITKLIDEETGKTIMESVHRVPDTFDNKKGYLFLNRRKNFKHFSDIKFPAVLTFADLGRLMMLAKQLDSTNNRICYRGHSGNKNCDFAKISEIIDLSERRTVTFINKMQELDIIAKADMIIKGKKEEIYYMNPIYFCAVRYLSNELYNIFKNQLDEVIPDWVKFRFNSQG